MDKESRDLKAISRSVWILNLSSAHSWIEVKQKSMFLDKVGMRKGGEVVNNISFDCPCTLFFDESGDNH